ncbi:MAG: hypothetical protein R3257_01530 [bacterium]|nr:hypothetical protein [bacterium]
MRKIKIIFTLSLFVLVLGVTGYIYQADAQISKFPAEPRMKISATQDGGVTDIEARISGASFLGGGNVLCCEADCGSETRACYAPKSKCGSVCESFCDCNNGAGVILQDFQSL